MSEPTKSTPGVSYAVNHHVQEIVGISTPVHAFEFYQVLVKWIDFNEKEIPIDTKFKFNLPYFNSATMKALLMLLERIKAGIHSSKNWSIVWVVEDEDEFMLDAAETLESMLGMKFQIITS
jgi:hypothetical protein